MDELSTAGIRMLQEQGVPIGNGTDTYAQLAEKLGSREVIVAAAGRGTQQFGVVVSGEEAFRELKKSRCSVNYYYAVTPKQLSKARNQSAFCF